MYTASFANVGGEEGSASGAGGKWNVRLKEAWIHSWGLGETRHWGRLVKSPVRLSRRVVRDGVRVRRRRGRLRNMTTCRGSIESLSGLVCESARSMGSRPWKHYLGKRSVRGRKGGGISTRATVASFSEMN